MSDEQPKQKSPEERSQDFERKFHETANETNAFAGNNSPVELRQWKDARKELLRWGRNLFERHES